MKRTLLAAVAVVTLLLPAMAEERRWTGTWPAPGEHGRPVEDIYSLLPPPEYDRPFKGKLYVTEGFDLAELRKLCDPSGSLSGEAISACTHLPGTHGLGPDECHIFMPDKKEIEERFPNFYGFLRRHEEGHCNGWWHKNPYY